MTQEGLIGGSHHIRFLEFVERKNGIVVWKHVMRPADFVKMGVIAALEYERTWDQNEELGLNDMDTAAADVAYAD